MYRILLADDEGIMLESLKKIIETEYGNECEIHCAKSGELWWRWHRHIRRISVLGYPDAGNKRNPGNQGNSEI